MYLLFIDNKSALLAWSIVFWGFVSLMLKAALFLLSIILVIILLGCSSRLTGWVIFCALKSFFLCKNEANIIVV
jgi:hypothetical protein